MGLSPGTPLANAPGSGVLGTALLTDAGVLGTALPGNARVPPAFSSGRSAPVRAGLPRAALPRTRMGALRARAGGTRAFPGGPCQADRAGFARANRFRGVKGSCPRFRGGRPSAPRPPRSRRTRSRITLRGDPPESGRIYPHRCSSVRTAGVKTIDRPRDRGRSDRAHPAPAAASDPARRGEMSSPSGSLPRLLSACCRIAFHGADSWRGYRPSGGTGPRERLFPAFSDVRIGSPPLGASMPRSDGARRPPRPPGRSPAARGTPDRVRAGAGAAPAPAPARW